MKKEFQFSKTFQQTESAEADKPELLTREKVASFLGVCVHTVDNYRRYEGLPSFKFGGHVRFSMADILTWLEAQRRKPESVK